MCDPKHNPSTCERCVSEIFPLTLQQLNEISGGEFNWIDEIIEKQQEANIDKIP